MKINYFSGTRIGNLRLRQIGLTSWPLFSHNIFNGPELGRELLSGLFLPLFRSAARRINTLGKRDTTHQTNKTKGTVPMNTQTNATNVLTALVLVAVALFAADAADFGKVDDSDGNYPRGNTAERISALASLTTNSNTTANDNAASGAQIVFAGGKGWTADVKQGEVVVKQGVEKMCIVKTQLPFVEETRFLNWQGKQCLAVKSRARHGPAALELFDAHTGALVDKIMAFAVENDKPAWAARWKE